MVPYLGGSKTPAQRFSSGQSAGDLSGLIRWYAQGNSPDDVRDALGGGNVKPRDIVSAQRIRRSPARPGPTWLRQGGAPPAPLGGEPGRAPGPAAVFLYAAP